MKFAGPDVHLSVEEYHLLGAFVLSSANMYISAGDYQTAKQLEADGLIRMWSTDPVGHAGCFTQKGNEVYWEFHNALKRTGRHDGVPPSRDPESNPGVG